jgi:hypothetical protein
MCIKKPIKGQSRKKKSKAKPSKGDALPGESSWFWFFLATIDFSRPLIEKEITYEDQDQGE